MNGLTTALVPVDRSGLIASQSAGEEGRVRKKNLLSGPWKSLVKRARVPDLCDTSDLIKSWELHSEEMRRGRGFERTF